MPEDIKPGEEIIPGDIKPGELDLQAIIDQALKYRDSGQQEWETFVRGELFNNCPYCQANLQTISDAVNAVKIPEIDISTKSLEAMIADNAILELRITGDIVQYQTSDGWHVGTVAKAK